MRGGAGRTVPVHEALGPVNQVLVEVLDEALFDSSAEIFVHCERFTRVVEGGTKAAGLAADFGTELLLPLPNLGNKSISTEVVTRQTALLLQPLFNDNLTRNTSVVLARKPENIEAAHAVPAGERVLDGHSESVTQVQGSGDVWGGQAAHIGGLARLGVSGVVAALSPPQVPAGLDSDGVEGGGERGGRVFFLSRRDGVHERSLL